MGMNKVNQYTLSIIDSGQIKNISLKHFKKD